MKLLEVYNYNKELKILPFTLKENTDYLISVMDCNLLNKYEEKLEEVYQTYIPRIKKLNYLFTKNNNNIMIQNFTIATYIDVLFREIEMQTEKM